MESSLFFSHLLILWAVPCGADKPRCTSVGWEMAKMVIRKGSALRLSPRGRAASNAVTTREKDHDHPKIRQAYRNVHRSWIGVAYGVVY
jgi:hypothetical protein